MGSAVVRRDLNTPFYGRSLWSQAVPQSHIVPPSLYYFDHLDNIISSCIKTVTAFPAWTCQAFSPIGTQGCEAKLETETPTQSQELPGWHPVLWLHWVKLLYSGSHWVPAVSTMLLEEPDLDRLGSGFHL